MSRPLALPPYELAARLDHYADQADGAEGLAQAQADLAAWINGEYPPPTPEPERCWCTDKAAPGSHLCDRHRYTAWRWAD